MSATPGKVVTITIGTVFLRAWILMLLLGGLHAEVDDRVPPLGYLITLGITWLVSTLIYLVRGPR